MKQYILIICCLAALLNPGTLFSQNRGGQPSDVKPQNFPLEINYYEWNTVKDPLNVSYVSTNKHFERNKVPFIPIESTWRATAWRGEKISGQLLVWTKKDIKGTSISTSSFSDGKGNVIPAGQTSFLTYVKTDIYQPDCIKKNQTSEIDSALVPDIIDTISRVSIPAYSVQPVWLSIKVPQSAVPGIYTGSVSVKTDGKLTRLQVSLRVLNKVLPEPSQFSYDLDLWQHPVAIARIHGTKLWSDDHFRAMKPYYQMLAGAGQKVATVAIIEEPWGHQTYDDYPGMIKVIKKKDGTWSYDYSLFDKYIEFVRDCGITRRINCYTMVAWDKKYRYFDEKTGKSTFLSTEVKDQAYKQFWLPLLNDFAKHLKQKNWFRLTSIAMDERSLEDMQLVISMLKESDPDWKIALAGSYHKEIVDDIFDYSIFKFDRFPQSELEKRHAKGQPSTFYTSCAGNFPNLYTFSSPVEAVWLSWAAAANGFSGYLRWAYNSWPKNPLTDSRFISFPAGDTFQIYPGPRSSVRFEKLIEGIQDYEKIKILRKEYSENGAAEKLKQLNSGLSAFGFDNLSEEKATQILIKSKALLE